LYEIVEGRPPHLLESVSASLESIRTCASPFAPDADAELVAICRRAMAKDPAQRYATADDLRIAIAEFLEHRTSGQIARESHERLRELEAQLASPEATRVTMYQLFGQCRFGFQAALRAWPENAGARKGLDRALAAMATHELDHGDPRAAAVLIAELSTPNAALSERLAAVEREAAEKRKRLERFELDQDIRAGQLTRTFFMTFLGIVWSAIPIVVDVFGLVTIDHPTSFAIPLVMLAFIVGFGVWARDSMTKSAINRGILVTVIVGCLLHATTEAIGWASDLPLPQTHMMSLAMWVGASGVAAVYMDRSLFVPTLAFIGALTVTVVAPAQRFIAMSLATFTMFGIAMYATYSQRRGRQVYGFAELLRRRDS
jgi:serine/threonine-protein kinase